MYDVSDKKFAYTGCFYQLNTLAFMIAYLYVEQLSVSVCFPKPRNFYVPVAQLTCLSWAWRLWSWRRGSREQPSALFPEELDSTKWWKANFYHTFCLCKLKFILSNSPFVSSIFPFSSWTCGQRPAARGSNSPAKMPQSDWSPCGLKPRPVHVEYLAGEGRNSEKDATQKGWKAAISCYGYR